MSNYHNWTRRRIEDASGRIILFESLIDPIDYSVFQKTEKERRRLKEMKLNCKNRIK